MCFTVLSVFLETPAFIIIKELLKRGSCEFCPSDPVPRKTSIRHKHVVTEACPQINLGENQESPEEPNLVTHRSPHNNSLPRDLVGKCVCVPKDTEQRTA